MADEERRAVVASLQTPGLERDAELEARMNAHYEAQKRRPPPTDPNAIEAAEVIGLRMAMGPGGWASPEAGPNAPATASTPPDGAS